MEPSVLASFAVALVAFGAVSRRMERGVVSPPMVFVALGFALGQFGWLASGSGLLDGLTVLTLVLVLFTDAARIDLAHLRLEGSLPARLLGLGLPLTVAAGAFAAWTILPGLGLWEAVLLGCPRAHGCRARTGRGEQPARPGSGSPGPQRGERPQRRHRSPHRSCRDCLRGCDGGWPRSRPLALLRDPAGDAGPGGGSSRRVSGRSGRRAVPSRGLDERALPAAVRPRPRGRGLRGR